MRKTRNRAWLCRARIHLAHMVLFYSGSARKAIHPDISQRTFRDMANTKSAKKAARQTIRRTEVNKSRRSRMRTYIRKVEEAIASGDHSVAFAALQAAQPEMMRAAQKGILHKNTAARKVSRLNKSVLALKA